MSKKFPFYGVTLEYSDEMILYNNLRSNFNDIGLHYQQAFNKMIEESVKRYKNDRDYDNYFATTVNNMSEIASLAVEFYIFTLMQYDIDTYDRERFMSLFEDNSGENLFSTDVRSAVSGEISAGIMNAGLYVVRDFSDSWQDSNDKA